jgi:hypothetical protein
MANPVPLNISTTLKTRDGTSTSKDARMTNVLVEMPSEGVKHFIKRPGYSIIDASNPVGALGSTNMPNGLVANISGIVGGGTNNATLTVVYPPGVNNFSSSKHAAVVALSNQQLKVTNTYAGGVTGIALSNAFRSVGKWYWEATLNVVLPAYAPGAVPYDGEVGIADSSKSFTNGTVIGDDIHGYSYTLVIAVGPGATSTYKDHLNSTQAYGTNSVIAGDIISVLFDADNGTLIFWQNGVPLGTAYTGISGSYCPAVSVLGDSCSITANFGATPFAYTIPAGYTTI